MTAFSPCTFSSDWENFVVDHLDRCVPAWRLQGFAGELNAELGLPITVDKESLEFPLGINTTFAQFWDRIKRTTDRASELLHDFQLRLFPAAAHPVIRTFNSSHIHVGTLTDESTGIYLENHLLDFIPAFAALAANSPASQGMVGEFKSYRVHTNAHYLIQPSSWRDPYVSQKIWGTDASPKLEVAPTQEIRITDCASSRRFLAELATFVTAFVQHEAKAVQPAPPDPQAYRDYLVNRWCAARDGMQATFRRHGRTITAAEMLAEMLDTCTQELQALGVNTHDLVLVNAMIDKRICQADLVLRLAERYPDPYALASVYGKLLRDWEWFDDYLLQATPLDPRPALSEQDIIMEHVKAIGEGTYYYRTRDVMNFPAAAADAVVEEAINAGLIRREYYSERGVVLSRIPSGTAGEG
ncbi:MAG TPA: glutamate-cysteine ligase family protein [Armatimonadota bacterium]|nr:glutamate-cysteine ligase family protein [Armatimonadota bacterium]